MSAGYFLQPQPSAQRWDQKKEFLNLDIHRRGSREILERTTGLLSQKTDSVLKGTGRTFVEKIQRIYWRTDMHTHTYTHTHTIYNYLIGTPADDVNKLSPKTSGQLAFYTNNARDIIQK